ncbi:MAG: prepilin peptidase [Bdellovibrionales bacterium]|nr:prepilin peptidase [Bdellovibrionales bacterium]
MNSWIFYILSFLILSACVMDVTSRKVSNHFVLFSAIICFALHTYIYGTSGIIPSLSSFAITSVVLLPLYIFGVIGGGDFKFFVALSFILSPWITTDIIILSILWGGLIGFLQSLISGEANTLMYSLYFKIKGLSRGLSTELKIPYTIAYLLGWLTWYRHGGLL